MLLFLHFLLLKSSTPGKWAISIAVSISHQCATTDVHFVHPSSRRFRGHGFSGSDKWAQHWSVIKQLSNECGVTRRRGVMPIVAITNEAVQHTPVVIIPVTNISSAFDRHMTVSRKQQ
jgi:hypothetical protein